LTIPGEQSCVPTKESQGLQYLAAMMRKQGQDELDRVEKQAHQGAGRIGVTKTDRDMQSRLSEAEHQDKPCSSIVA
jgi:hypothetical protein